MTGARLRVGLLSPEEILRRSSGELSLAELPARSGHITLAVPVVHPRFLAMRPSPLALLLGVRAGAVRRLLSDVELLDARLRAMDLEALETRLDAELKQARRPAKRRWLAKRLGLVRGLKQAGLRPEWLVVKVLPVLPPALRPSHALYRRVLERNEAVKALPPRAHGAPPSREELALRRAVAALFAGLGARVNGRMRRLVAKRLDFAARGSLLPDPTLRLDECRLPIEAVFSLYGPLLLRRLKDAGVADTLAEARALLVECGPRAREVIDSLLRESPLVVAREDVRTHLDVVALEPRLGEGQGIGCHPALFERLGDERRNLVGLYLPWSARAREEVRRKLSVARHFLSPATGAPLLTPSKEALYGLWYATRSRAGARGEGRVFASPDEVALAYEQGCVELASAITVRIEERGRRTRVATTVGRILLFRELDGEVPFSALNRTLHRDAVAAWLTSVFHGSGGRAAVALAERLWRWGQARATAAGLSLAAEHFHPPEGHASLIAAAAQEHGEVEQSYENGLLTVGERDYKVHEIWSEATANVARAVRDGLVEGDPLADLLTSGAVGDLGAVQRLRGMTGRVMIPSRAPFEWQIRHSLFEGLSPLEFFFTASRAHEERRRMGAWNRRLRGLQRELLGALGPVRVTQEDCGTREGVTVSAEVFEHRVRVGLVPRLNGRTATAEVRSPDGQQVLVRAGESIDAATASRLERWGVYRVPVRSVSTCEAEEGVCARCHGWEPGSARPVSVGDAVGLSAARMLRTLVQPPEPIYIWIVGGSFHGRDDTLGAEVSARGVVHFENIHAEPRESSGHQGPEPVLVMVGEEGRLSVRDDAGTERESFRVRKGDRIHCEDGQRVEPGHFLLRSVHPDAELVVVDASEGMLSVELPLNLVRVSGWPTHAQRGDVLGYVKELMPLGSDPSAKALAELLHARRAPADDRPVFSDVVGRVRVVPSEDPRRSASQVKLFLHSEEGGPPRVVSVPRSWKLSVSDGEAIHVGQELVTGTTTLHEVLRVLGTEDARVKLVTFLERLFLRNQTSVCLGWLELLARQMLGQVLIEDGGDTGLLPGERVPWRRARRLDAQALLRGGRSATWTPVFTGLHTLAREGGPLNGALFGDAVESWARAALTGRGEPSTSPLLRLLAGLGPR